MERLPPLDLMALWPDEAGQWQDMGGLAVVGPRLDGLAFDSAWADGVQAHLASRLDRAPRLRQTLHVPPPPGLGRPLWVDEQSPTGTPALISASSSPAWPTRSR